MKLFNIINKFALVLFWFFLISLCGLLVYVNNTQNLKTYNYAKNIKKILKFKRDEILPRFLNDYNSNFLPETHFINLKFFQKKQNFLTINDCYIETCYTFYLEKNKKNIFLIDKNNNLYYSNIKNFLSKKNSFKKIDTNLNFLGVSDLYINENNIYVSGYKKNNNNDVYISIYKSSLNNLKSIDFKEIFKAKNNECIFQPAHAGKMKHLNNDSSNGLLFTTRWLGKVDEPNLKNLLEDNICGKVLLINENTSEYEIFSKGHRNIIGLYSDKDVVIATENGPAGGDEINKIQKNKNYGWPVASYGDKYFRKKDEDLVSYKKNHKQSGFEEPIFSFVPSIGISEIIKLPNNFANFWQNNFLFGSLNKKTIYRVEFDENFKKIIYFEEIFVGDRVRDILYLDEEKTILFSLEMSGSIGIIQK